MDYGFATGRVMVLRNRLLGPSTFERLLDAPGLAEQKRVLAETHFGACMERARTAADIEGAIDGSLHDLYAEFLEHSGLPADVVRYFRVSYDFAALKGVLKARLLGGAPELPPRGLGTLPAEAFEEPGHLPGTLGRAAREAAAVTEPDQVDALVDRAMFGELQRLATSSGVAFLGRLAKRESDIANAKVLLRSAIAHRTPDATRAMLVPSGSWKAERLADLVSRPQELVEAVQLTRVFPAASAEDLLDPSRLDVLADAALARLVRESARGEIGPEPVLGYVLARRAEAIAVRSVLVGRLAGLPREIVATRLRGATS